MAAQADGDPTQSTTQYDSKVLEHLGMVAGMVDELALVEMIDAMLPKDEGKRTLSHGQAVKAMLLNGLGFSHRALYLTPLFFKDKPVERLLGAGITADMVNDDALGRTLDAIHQYGVERFYSQLSVRSTGKLKLHCATAHLDSTSLHVDGAYNSHEPPEEDGGTIHITQGYSRDHRPDLNQVVAQFICENQAGIPLLMAPLSGHGDDKSGFRATIKEHIAQLKTDMGLEYLVADSAFYTAETLKESHHFFWVSRVPETLSLARQAIIDYAPSLMRQPDEMTMQAISSHYADIEQRWLVVYSPQARNRSIKTVAKQCGNLSAKEVKIIKELLKQEFACEADARAALAKCQKGLVITHLSDILFAQAPRHKKPGRPPEGAKPDRMVVQISATLHSDPAIYMQKLQRKSCFILATNQLDTDTLPDDKLLQTYKGQQKVERGFRFLKDPMFMASTLFLKSVKRIMALMGIMTLCLLVYAALEYRIRKALKERDETFPNQLGVGVANPTARWVFQYFKGIHLLVINQAQAIVLHLNDTQTKLLRLLGDRYLKIYS
jgi:transposase